MDSWEDLGYHGILEKSFFYVVVFFFYSGVKIFHARAFDGVICSLSLFIYHDCSFLVLHISISLWMQLKYTKFYDLVVQCVFEISLRFLEIKY
ncbi:hypothetical protein DFH27DRAFT_556803 [Peziza echinospora]|nr:hypothetical protein DFH27DRAFT_556803 [Peziza echinospora]